MTVAHQLRRLVASRFARHPYPLQRVRWPNPLRPPYLEPEITLYRPGELGDVVMCLAVVQAIRERNPTARITFVTHFHELLKGHPQLDRVLPVEAITDRALRNVVSLRYEVFIPPRLHLIDYFGGCVGLRDIAHEIALPDFRAELGEVGNWISLPRPWVIVTRRAGFFTPNKDWPMVRWEELIRRLAAHATVVEVGTDPAAEPLAPRHVDLRGRTTVRQYCALVSLADLVISPITSSVHVAAAYDVPTVSLAGGYERPENTAYPRHTALYRSVPCSPCWRRDECPIGIECLRQISVDDVLSAALPLLA